MTVVATAGHVDHGKSTLVLALTGTDPDRFAEEKARGLTIDLGFAACDLPGGGRLELVDVPGHVRFLSNMLAGVGAVSACLFVVAATEGWKPQSEEHLRIVELLGIRDGVVALTKVGLLDEDLTELARLEVAERLAGSPLAAAPIIAVDALAGIGVDDLRAALAALLARAPEAADSGRPRLWVDRSFAIRGSGTVVTGTLAGGSLAVGDEVEVRPSGRRARVRGLQSHGVAVGSIGPGHRVAVNLSGVSHHDVDRGGALVQPGRWVTTSTVDASLSVLPALDHDVSRRGAHALHVGTAEVPVKLRVLGPTALAPGTVGHVRLHLATPLALVPGDRFVLREHGRGETVGGGEVLDVAPSRPASKAAPSRSVERVVGERGWVAADELERLVGHPVEPTVPGWVASPAAVAATPPSDDRWRLLVAAGLVDAPETVSVPTDDPWLAAARATPFSPPPGPVDRALLTAGLVVERDGTYFAQEAVDEAALRTARLLAEHPEGVTLGQLREAWGTTRKWAVPLATILDTTGITRRRGDVRIPGPRLPTV